MVKEGKGDLRIEGFKVSKGRRYISKGRNILRKDEETRVKVIWNLG